MTLSVSFAHKFSGFTLDVAFEAPAGVTVLFGRSGSGKTTVVNAVAGLLRPQRGRISLGDLVLLDTESKTSLPVHRRRLGYVFQEGRLFPHLTVRQNLNYGRWFQPRADGPDLDRVLDMLGIEALLRRRPGALSGGEKQRVAIGRALLSNPQLLLMDEPLAALDGARKAEILPYLERLRDQTAIPILYVSHSVAEVARLATTVVMLDAGHVVRSGPAAEVLTDLGTAMSPETDMVSFITARVEAHEADGLTRLSTRSGNLFLPRVSGSIGLTLRVLVHAHDVILSRSRPTGLSALNILPATVTDLRHVDGATVIVRLALGGDIILASLTERSARAMSLAPGNGCFVIMKSLAIAPLGSGTADGRAEPSPSKLVN